MVVLLIEFSTPDNQVMAVRMKKYQLTISPPGATAPYMSTSRHRAIMRMLKKEYIYSFFTSGQFLLSVAD